MLIYKGLRNPCFLRFKTASFDCSAILFPPINAMTKNGCPVLFIFIAKRIPPVVRLRPPGKTESPESRTPPSPGASL